MPSTLSFRSSSARFNGASLARLYFMQSEAERCSDEPSVTCFICMTQYLHIYQNSAVK